VLISLINNINQKEDQKMQTLSLILLILLAALLSLLVFWKESRDYLGEKIAAAGKLIKTHFPAAYSGIKKFFRFLARIIGAYALFVLVSSVLALLLVTIALISGSATFIAIAFIFTLSVLLLAWLPTGAVLKVIGVNKEVIPQSLKTFVSWVALFGFLAMLYPELIGFKLFLALNLISFIIFGTASKFKFLDKVFIPLVIGICFIYAWQYFLPDNFRSTSRYLSSWSKRISTVKDRGSIGNEVEAVATYGELLRDIKVLYQLNGDELQDQDYKLDKRTIVKVVDHKQQVMVYDGQGFILIQLAKENGSFVGGKKYWIEAEFVRLLSPNELVSQDELALEDNSFRLNENPNALNVGGDNIIKDESRADFLLYGTGKTYTYTLKAGEETPWRGFQPGIVSNYFVSSENLDGINYDYTIFYSDGTTHKAGPEEALPAKKGNIFLKVRANSPQTVYVTVF